MIKTLAMPSGTFLTVMIIAGSALAICFLC